MKSDFHTDWDPTLSFAVGTGVRLTERLGVTGEVRLRGMSGTSSAAPLRSRRDLRGGFPRSSLALCSMKANEDFGSRLLALGLGQSPKQLGLKLESRRGPVEFLVIDNVERPAPD